jgi:hypothetical protein
MQTSLSVWSAFQFRGASIRYQVDQYSGCIGILRHRYSTTLAHFCRIGALWSVYGRLDGVNGFSFVFAWAWEGDCHHESCLCSYVL